MPASHEFASPLDLAVDCLVFREMAAEASTRSGKRQPPTLEIALIRRGVPPHRGEWALPGGLVKKNEPVEKAAGRELYEETGIDGVFLEQFRVFSEVDRDPRRRIATVAFTGAAAVKPGRLTPGGDAEEAAWFSVKALPPLAFDHQVILDKALEARKAKKPHCYVFPRPALTVDCVIFGVDKQLKLLLIQRKETPFQDRWALPGGFVGIDESTDEAAKRELQEETGLTDVYLEQLYTFSEPLDRDPRERTVTVAYFALVKRADHQVKADSDAKKAAWHAVAKLPPLAFDHAQIVAKAVDRLKAKVRYQPIGFHLLPPKFTLTELQELYEILLGEQMDKRNFRKKILAMKILKPLKEFERGVSHRAARYFRFDKEAYDRLEQKGFTFHL